MRMTFGSLFAGIGGMDLGLERAGMTCAWQVEIDPFCRRVLAKHWHEVPKHDDVRTFPDGELDRWRVDLIAGGFPCQDISSLGSKAGIDGERSALWVQFSRIVRLVRPRYVVVENVGDLAVRGLGRVLGDLAAMGFDAEWQVLPASAFGAPHRRDRLFIVADAAEIGRDGDRPILCQHAAQDADGRPDGDPSWRGKIVRGPGGRARLAPRSGLRRMADGLPSGLDRIAALGNAVVPQVAEWIGRRILEHAEAAPCV
jgi:DNA (cytosine-5)-methyltransferase 1